MNKLSPIKRKLRSYISSHSSHYAKITMPKLDYLNDKEEVNMEALSPWSLALRHLYLYFEGERMDRSRQSKWYNCKWKTDSSSEYILIN